MNLKRLLRQIHYWLSLAVFLPTGIIIAAGLFLMLKKEIAWIQPSTTTGSVVEQLPAASYQELLDAVIGQPEAGVSQWTDIDRVDIRPDRGIAKLTAKTGWEVQVDTATAEVLSVAYRRSDLIESIHDGSYFSKEVKLYLFFPTGILLLFMWGTGIYLFLLPQLAKRKKARRQKRSI